MFDAALLIAFGCFGTFSFALGGLSTAWLLHRARLGQSPIPSLLPSRPAAQEKTPPEADERRRSGP